MEELSKSPISSCNDEGTQECCPVWEEDAFPEVPCHEVGTDAQGEHMELDCTDQLLMLSEDDIPGASLNGKKPSDLNVIRLKRWLACRGAPLSGNKAQLIERVQCYIKFGWDEYLIDPDNGINSQRKLSAAAGPNSFHHYLLESIPEAKDPQWISRLYDLPKITFGTMFDYLVDRLVLLKRVSSLEGIADERAFKAENNFKSNVEVEVVSGATGIDDEGGEYVPVECTRTLKKAYCFFQDGHVHNVKFHAMPSVQDCVCVSSNVLPSMRKDRIYKVFILLHQSSGKIFKAYCSCPAGLSGCCNHTTATLYCLEDYIHRGLQDDERKGCTDRLQTWNQSTPRSSSARPTDDVILVKHEYGVEKRARDNRINHWDCRPVSRRIIDPNKSRTLRTVLSNIAKKKLAAASKAVDLAKTEAEKKKADRDRAVLKKYGPSCFVQLFDDEPAPSESHEDEVKKQRLARAAFKKETFQRELAAKLNHVNHDHTYSSNGSNKAVVLDGKQSSGSSQLHNILYEHLIVLDSFQAIKLEENTRMQFACGLWHDERKFRITASIMKEVCHRKPSTNPKAFVEKKLFPKPLKTPAICYGRKHEDDAILSYLKYQNNCGIFVDVRACGLIIDPCIPWLAASPDRIIFGQNGEKQGCLEVKCPYVCEKKSIIEASRNIFGFCLVENNGSLHLSNCHGYFYQVQTQMHVTNTKWCDFVVWSPREDPFVECIKYDSIFMEWAISVAKEFYFKKFLPSVIPYVTVPSRFSTNKSDEISTRSTAPSVIPKSTAPSIFLKSTASSIIPKSTAPPVIPKSTAPPVIPKSTAPAVIHKSTAPSVIPKSTTPSIIPKSTAPAVIPKSTAPPIIPKSTAPSIIPKSTAPSVIPKSIAPAVFLKSTAPPVFLKSTDPPVFLKSTAPSVIPKSTAPLVIPKSTSNAASANEKDIVECLGINVAKSTMSMDSLLSQLHVRKHLVKGDGSCLYHAVAHQAGLIPANSKGDSIISMELRKVVLAMMLKYPHVRQEDGLSMLQWLEKKQDVSNPNSWGGDLELRLLALGLQRSIVVVTSSCADQFQSPIAYARKFPASKPPVPKMRGGIFVPFTAKEVCEQWNTWIPSPLLIIYNGHSHYDSTQPLSL